jgi:hypothetical protein
MVFTKRLREGIRRGRIRCSVRIWMRPHVKVGGRYAMDDGHIVVDSIAPITIADVTDDLARESGFESVEDLLRVAKHGRGDNIYLIRFHYLPPGAWDTPEWRQRHGIGHAGEVPFDGRHEAGGHAGRAKAPIRRRSRRPGP